MTSDSRKAYWEQRDNVAWVYLDSPETRNALGTLLINSVVECLDEIRERDDIGAVCLTGAGGVSWCSGQNLREMGNPNGPRLNVDKIHDGIRYFPKVVIGVVNGYCIGGGISLLCNCDLGIASDKAIFGLPELARGGPPGRAIGELLHTVPQKYAFDLILSSRNWDANKALMAGLVSRVVEHEQLVETAQHWASDVATFDPGGVANCKRIMHRILDILPRDQRIQMNLLRDAAARASRGMFGDSPESAVAFLRHDAGTKATKAQV